MMGHSAQMGRDEAIAAPYGPDATRVTPVPAPQARSVASAHQVGQSPELDVDLMSNFERLASRILFAEEAECFTLVVTSALSGEGVTTTCVGVALALARSTNRAVLLVDANLRRPALHDLFKIRQQPGLHEMIPHSSNLDGWIQSDRASLGSLGVTPTSVPNLFVVPSGATLGAPTQLLTSEASRRCFEFLSSRFDFVIIDCPPLLTAVEAGSVCRLGTGITIVIRAGLTLRDDVRRAQERLQGAPVMGVVLNGA